MRTYQKRSKVLRIANSLKIKGWNFGDAQRQGWKVVRAIEAMKEGKAIIKFYKADDEAPQERAATLSRAFFSYTSTSTKKRKSNPLQICFWDTVKNGFRSFNAARFASYTVAPLPF